MTATENKVVVGQKVLVVERHGSRPMESTVSKVTIAGRIRVASITQSLYQDDDHRGYYIPVDAARFERRRVYLHSEEMLAKLLAERDAELERQRLQKVKDEEAAARIAAELKAEVDQLQAVMPELPAMTMQLLADQTRLYVFNIPVKERCQSNKKGFELLIVRCRDAQRYEFKTGVEVPCVEAHYTYANGGTSSFSSCSGNKFNTDEEAMWDAARRQFHSSW